MKISIIGVGRLGGALAIALAEKGFEIEYLLVRNYSENARKVAGFIEPKPQILKSSELALISSDAIFITTEDAEIVKVAENLARRLKNKSQNKPLVFHASGSLSSEALASLKQIGCAVASVHPLAAFSDSVLGARNFADAFFCVEGDDQAVEKAKEIIEILGGKSFSIETKYKTLYHASAVTASGHLVALFDVAIEMLTACGLEENRAREVLLPLVRSAIENLRTQNAARALTGTFARADAQTLQRQIEILSEAVSKEAFEVFLQLGLRSLHLAKRQNADSRKIEEMRAAIELAKKNLK